MFNLLDCRFSVRSIAYIQSVQVKAFIVFDWKSSMTSIEHNEDLSIEQIELRLRLSTSGQRKGGRPAIESRGAKHGSKQSI